MTNIEKALEAHPRPWSRGRCIEHTNLTSIETSDGATVLMGPVNIPLVDLIIAAVNAYELEKVCSFCLGGGMIPPWKDAPTRQTCSACNGAGKQPDAREVDSEAIHLLSLEIEKRDKVIAEMVFLLECFMEGDADAKRMNQATKVLANIKEMVG